LAHLHYNCFSFGIIEIKAPLKAAKTIPGIVLFVLLRLFQVLFCFIGLVGDTQFELPPAPTKYTPPMPREFLKSFVPSKAANPAETSPGIVLFSFC